LNRHCRNKPEWPKAITLQGEVLRVAWINPHILLFLQSKNEQGELETWTVQGAALNNAMRQVGLKERLQHGISISARVWPPRKPAVCERHADGLADTTR
jgi:hypothetical protein